MAKLDWISEPGVKAQANLGDTAYYVVFPSVWMNLSDPSENFSEPRQYMTTAMKKTNDGMLITYVVGHNFNNVNQASIAAEEDYDRWGEAIPPDRMPPMPSPPPEAMPVERK